MSMTDFSSQLPDMERNLSEAAFGELLSRYDAAVFDPNRYENWSEILSAQSRLRAPRGVVCGLDKKAALWLMNGKYDFRQTELLGKCLRSYMDVARARHLGGPDGEYYLRPTGKDEPFDFRSHLISDAMSDLELGTCACNVSDTWADGLVRNTGFVIQERVALQPDPVELLNGMPLIRAARVFYNFKTHEVVQAFPYYEHVRPYCGKHHDVSVVGYLSEKSAGRFDDMTDFVLCAAAALSGVRDHPGVYGSAHVWYLDFIEDASGELWFVNAGMGVTDRHLYGMIGPDRVRGDALVVRDPVSHAVVEMPVTRRVPGQEAGD